MHGCAGLMWIGCGVALWVNSLPLMADTVEVMVGFRNLVVLQRGLNWSVCCYGRWSGDVGQQPAVNRGADGG